MPSVLQQEFDYYLAHKDELLAKYNGRFVVIKDCKPLGAYATELEAVTETQKQGHALGSFLVQKVEPGDAAYTQTFHSRVSFAQEDAANLV